MKRIVLQVVGVVVILLGFGAWWLLDLYACAFNTNGCARTLPRLNAEAASFVALPTAVGLLLIVLGRRVR